MPSRGATTGGKHSDMIKEIPHQYIVVEGPIGVGKTHLVKRLAESCSGTVLLEQPENNPFLEKFY